MSLRSKVLVIVLGVVSLYAALDYAGQYFFVLPSFISLERNEAQNTIRRCVASLKRETCELEKTGKGLAASHHTSQFVKDRDKNQISENLALESLMNRSLDLIYICDTSDEVIWGQTRHLQTNETVQAHGPLAELGRRICTLHHNQTTESSSAGIFTTEQGTVLVASTAILADKNEGPILGTLVVGRFLEANVLQAITEHLPVDLKIWTIANGPIPEEEKDVLNQIKTESQFNVREVSDDLLQVHAVVSDAQGAPALLMQADIPRDIRAKAIAGLIRSNFLSNLAAGLFIALVLFLLMQGAVIGPIRKLTGHVVKIGASGNIIPGPTTRRTDEIGTLAKEFNRMVEQLADSQRKLSEQSYYLGKAEVASGVLHNACNVLTPLVSRIDSLRQKLHDFPIEKVEKIQTELADARLSNQRRKHLTELISLSNESLVSLVLEAKDKLGKITKHVERLEDIVAEQGRFTRTKATIENIRLSGLVRDAFYLLPSDLVEGISFEIDPTIEAAQPIKAHGITLLQIFNNVLLNAVESINRTRSVEGRISIRAAVQNEDGVDIVHIRITDNGEGIDPGNTNYIFERDASPRRGARGGVGLHWCANAIANMDGRIYAESEGKNRGACINILIPSVPDMVSVGDAKGDMKS
ncbi:MAG: CHASE4 domain-containing protein [Planctomycetota bacterium]|jgi:sensor domain CHASE-containing protein